MTHVRIKKGPAPLERPHLSIESRGNMRRICAENSPSGFTLIETLVAISILLLVVIGPITVAQRGIKSAFYANEQVTAVFLAQEAIEAIRELRDSDALAVYGGSPNTTWDWYSNLNANCTVSLLDLDNQNLGCAFDPVSGGFESCGGNNGCELTVGTLTREYSYETGANFVDSGYTRKVRVGPLTGGGIPIQVEVRWTSQTFGGGTNPPVVLNTWLYDHFRRYEEF